MIETDVGHVDLLNTHWVSEFFRCLVATDLGTQSPVQANVPIMRRVR